MFIKSGFEQPLFSAQGVRELAVRVVSGIHSNQLGATIEALTQYHNPTDSG
jgi:hypothetical protein